ncbi:MAG: AraC family transcriptional regulator [Lachnospiraceae bacterium]|nr:AraC family transcriptional regulator [Lachnospiraceae bacterium]
MIIRLIPEVRKASGTSVWKYISIKRLLAAHARILRGDSVSEAAYACGFGDYSSFFRMYKKHFGRAPSIDKKR